MPRFYFDVGDGADRKDDYGMELADIDAAQVEAMRLGAAISLDDPQYLLANCRPRIDVRAADGRVLCQLELKGCLHTHAATSTKITVLTSQPPALNATGAI